MGVLASQAPIAAEAVKRIDVLFAIEREINGLAPRERLRVRQERSRPLKRSSFSGPGGNRSAFSLASLASLMSCSPSALFGVNRKRFMTSSCHKVRSALNFLGAPKFYGTLYLVFA
jgi:transposase IS66 family protein